MNFSIRPVQPSDQVGVLTLAPRLLEGMSELRDGDRSLAAVNSWVEGSASAEFDGVALVAVSDAGPSRQSGDDQVIGFVSLSTTGHFTGETDAYIGELVVDDSWAGRGVGRALVAAVEEVAVERGHRCITLTTGSANGGALAFYNKLGYQAEDVTLTKVLR